MRSSRPQPSHLLLSPPSVLLSRRRRRPRRPRSQARRRRRGTPLSIRLRARLPPASRPTTPRHSWCGATRTRPARRPFARRFGAVRKPSPRQSTAPSRLPRLASGSALDLRSRWRARWALSRVKVAIGVLAATQRRMPRPREASVGRLSPPRQNPDLRRECVTVTESEWGDSAAIAAPLAPSSGSQPLWLPFALVLVSQIPLYVSQAFEVAEIILTLPFRTCSLMC